MLGEAHKLKEAFYGVYEASTSRADALERYGAWSKSVPPEIWLHFADLIRAFTNWQPWILNYFDHKVTNAYTDSLNSLIRVMNRMGRGYSFEALRAKILFTEGAYKLSRPKFERIRVAEPAYGVPDNAMGCALPVRMRREVARPMKSIDQHEPPEPPKSYGADISTLVRLIEAGKL